MIKLDESIKVLDYHDYWNIIEDVLPTLKDGKMIKEQSLAEIRNILHGGKF